MIVEGNRIFLKPADEPRIEIFPESESDFFTKDRITEITRQANDSRIKMALDFSQNESDLMGVLKGDSDPVMRNIIPSLALSRGAMPPAYHSPDDDAETLDYEKITNAARLLYIVLDQMGNE